MNAERKIRVPFLRSIRGKMATSFTLVTVFIVVMVLGVVAGFLFLETSDRFGTSGYLREISNGFHIQSYDFYAENKFDIEKLQERMDLIHEQGFLSLPRGNFIDTSMAYLITNKPFFVIDSEQKVVASTSQTPGYRVGDHYAPPESQSEEKERLENLLQYAHRQDFHFQQLQDGNIQVYLPFGETDEDNTWHTKYIVVMTVAPAPPFSFKPFLRFLPFVLITVAMVIMIVTPFGVIFGLMAGRGLNRRITNLVKASDQLAQGNFEAIPTDKSKDEIGVLNRQMRTMSEKLQTLMQNQQQLAAIEERNHLARELHDTVKQQNFATQMQIRAAQNLIATDPEQAGVRLFEAERILKSSQDELSTIIRQLRPAQLEDRGLAATLRQLLRDWVNRNQIPMQVNITGERRIALSHEQALLRVAQEALSNIARHAKANRVWFSLDYSAEMVTMTLQDNGVGFSRKSQGKGMGLENMQQRVESLGGWFATSSAPGKGTKVEVSLPIVKTGP